MLTQEKINEIEQKTREILTEEYGNLRAVSPLINIGNILRKHGIQLVSAVFDNPEVSGAYDASKKTIYVSQNEDKKTRQFFTVAHELGHFFLHPPKKEEVFYRSQMNQFSDQDQNEEQESNWFAASLLMPKELVEREWKEHPDEKYIAARFGVSLAAAHWRLKNLGLIG